MQQSILAVIVIISITTQAYGQNKNSCDISSHYNDFISIQKANFNEKNVLIKRVIETDKKSCYSDLVNNNTMFIDYLLKNFSSNLKDQDLLQLSDSITLRKTYFRDLQKDSLFNGVMTNLVSKTLDDKIKKDNLSMDKLMNIAIKYFSIMRLTDEGNYAGKVCAGLNDIKKTEKERKPFVEAFCFSAILKHYKSEEFSMYNEFVGVLKELYKVNLGIDKDERLLRAQGAVFLLMRNNENLNLMLKIEYERQKEFLPFILTDT